MRSHGSYGRYNDGGCRCDACTAANRTVHKRNLLIRLARTAANGGVAPVTAHGKSTYDNWGCRCPVCCDAKRKANAAYKALLAEARRAKEAEALRASETVQGYPNTGERVCGRQRTDQTAAIGIGAEA